MSAYLLTAPAAEPLSLADAKAFLRVEHGDDDAIITSLVASARNHVEALTRCGLITQTWRIVLDRWPDNGRVAPRLGPLRSLSAARVFNESNVASPIDVTSFVVDRAGGVIAAQVAYWGFRFGVLGVYVSGRTREKMALATGQETPGALDKLINKVVKKK